MSAIQERIETVLKEHVKGWWKSDGKTREVRCKKCNDLNIGNMSLEELERFHLVDVLSELFTETQAEAWDKGWASARAGIIPTGNEPTPRNPYRSNDE